MRRVAIAQPPVFRNPPWLLFAKSRGAIVSRRPVSSQPQAQQREPSEQHKDSPNQGKGVAAEKKKKEKTMADLDAELQRKMSGLSGDGGEAGIEYEDGKPVAMKRSVRNNMFRYI
ncbi:hypothetical protein F4677DRAFT_29573 [Hypoxylon crocopeplum]|nr:hypothetical protein F4677DRAFT_29573 [Hypoxylon crocopeplum]